MRGFITQCNGDPPTFLVEDDDRRFVGMVQCAGGRWIAYLGTDSADPRPLGYAGSMAEAVAEVFRVHDADKLVRGAIAWGKLGRAIHAAAGPHLLAPPDRPETRGDGLRLVAAEITRIEIEIVDRTFDTRDIWVGQELHHLAAKIARAAEKADREEGGPEL